MFLLHFTHYRIHMDIGISKLHLGIQAIINNPQGKRIYKYTNNNSFWKYSGMR